MNIVISQKHPNSHIIIIILLYYQWLIQKVTDNVDREDSKQYRRYEYPNMTKTLGGFKLQIEKGSFTDSEIIVLLGILIILNYCSYWYINSSINEESYLI
jgi:hypothetical protein